MTRLVSIALCAFIVSLAFWGAVVPPAMAQTTAGVDALSVVYQRLDEQLALGQGRIGALGRPALKPEVPETDEEDAHFVPQTREARRREVEQRIERSVEARRAEQAARLQAFSQKVAEQCGAGPLGPATLGMTVQRFEQCSPEIRFGGGVTHVISLVVQGMAGKLYVFNGDRVHKVYAVDGRITRIDPPALHAVQPSLLSLGTYPQLVSDPQMVALSGGNVFAYGPALGEDWSAPAGANLRAWGKKRDRIHTSVPAPPFMWDAEKQGWLRFQPPVACGGLWHQHTLTVMDNDRVLVAGGLCDISRLGNDMGTFEPQRHTALWDGRQRVWLDAPDLAQPRIQHTASLVDGQRVLLVGGFDDPLTTAEQEAPRVAQPADQPAPPHVRALRSVEWFTEGRFEQLAPLNTARAKHTATVLASGGVLVVGGVGSDLHALAQVEAWDKSSLRWVPRAPLRTARYGHTATLLADGRVLVTGGIDANEALLNTTEIYDPAADTWSDGPPLPEHLQGHSSMLLPDGRVLLAGGLAFPIEQRTPWLHTWLPGELSWQALGIRGQGAHGNNQHRPTLVPLGQDRVLIFSSLTVWLHRLSEPAAATATSGAAADAAAGAKLPHFVDTWWVPPPQAATPPPLPPTAGQPGLLARLAQDLWSARASLLVLAMVLGGLWLLARLWTRLRTRLLRKRVDQAGPSPDTEAPIDSIPSRVGRLGRFVVRVLVYGTLLVLAAPHILAYMGLQLSDMADACQTRPAACLNPSSGLLARQWGVPGRSKFSSPRVPCGFVGEWSITLRSREFSVAMQADGTYQMKSAVGVKTVPDDAGHWAVQGKYLLWRSTTRQVADIDMNQIVSNDGIHFELIEMDGVHTHFKRRAELPPQRCQP